MWLDNDDDQKERHYQIQSQSKSSFGRLSFQRRESRNLLIRKLMLLIKDLYIVNRYDQYNSLNNISYAFTEKYVNKYQSDKVGRVF